MQDLKFVIYGAGYRGKRLLEYLGKDKVVAFIDKNPSIIGTSCNGISIVNLNDYKLLYSEYEIIVTPVKYREINIELENNGIVCYTNLNELPSEFSGYGKQKFCDCYKDILKRYFEPCYVYGKNAFGYLVYNTLEGLDNKVSWIEKYDKQEKGHIFVTCYEDINKLSEKFVDFDIIDAYDYSSNLLAYYNYEIAEFRGRYRDKKRCFIVATGPSLRREDLNILQNMKEFSISMNRIYNIRPIWYPDIYVVTDSVLMLEDAEKIKEYGANIKFYSDANKAPDDGIVIHCVQTNLEKNPRFSEDLAQKVYGGGTVTYTCIQLAVYLGFKEIYLLGVDCKYEYKSNENHFYKVASEDKFEHNTDGMIKAFESAKKYADAHGIKIYNATRGGALEVFDRVDFDALFEK